MPRRTARASRSRSPAMRTRRGEQFADDEPDANGKPLEDTTVADALGDSDLPQRGALAVCFPTWSMVCIWSGVVLNYVVLVLIRPELWPAPVLCLGHTMLPLLVTSFLYTMRTPPGSVPPSWHAEAALGKVQYVLDDRTGQRLPPRSRYVFRAKQAVLALDHFCFWLDVPIGLHNRKSFVLFLCYSGAGSGIALGFVLYDLGAM
eukprot:4989616-Prymnesium_polylepis.3